MHIFDSLLAEYGPTDPEAGLTRRLKCKEPEAYTELIEKYERPIYGFVYRLLDSTDDAPDVTQEVFVKVFRNIDDFRGDSTLKTWIYRIAVHEASNRRRWFSRHRGAEVSIDASASGSGTSTWEWLRDGRQSPYERLQHVEQMDLVADALREVDERLRAAVVMRDLEGMSYNEISVSLEVSLGTVKSRILRGREALRVALRRRMAGTVGVPQLQDNGVM
jgi:RNA polymerase sigma-70 factor (ECF subfamily)